MRAVPRGARGHEEGKRGAAIPRAGVPEALPHCATERAPAARIVDAELGLLDHLRRLPRAARAPGEHTLELALPVVREERLPVRGDREPLRRGVARDELRRARDSGRDRARRRDSRGRGRRAQEPATARRNPSGAVSAPDPDVERFLLTLQARRSPRTVDAYRRDLKAFATAREGHVADATVEDVEAWLAGMRADGLASSTIARRVSAVRTYFRHLVLIGAGTENPAASVQLPRRPRTLPRALSPAETERLIDAAVGTTPRALR
ncbi:MAG: site-specific integrase, partial [Gaiellaceae bacterium]